MSQQLDGLGRYLLSEYLLALVPDLEEMSLPSHLNRVYSDCAECCS
jgi:hypothetical protein